MPDLREATVSLSLTHILSSELPAIPYCGNNLASGVRRLIELSEQHEGHIANIAGIEAA